jgi:hypothetical protein
LSVRATGHLVWNRARATAAGHAPEARAPPATRSASWRLCCPCALTKTRPYLLEAEAKNPFSPSHSPSLPLLSRQAATLLCSGRRRAADSSRLLPPSGTPRRCRADTSVPGANRQLHQPHRMTPSPSFHRHQGVPPWTDLPVSPRRPPTPQIGPPLRRGAPRPVSPPPRAASDQNRWPPSPARHGERAPLLRAQAARPCRPGLKANLAGPCNLGQARAINPSGLCAQYLIIISIWIILNNSNEIQTSEFSKKFNKFHKNMKPLLVFDFKDNL